MNQREHVLNALAIAGALAWFSHGGGLHSALWLFGYLVAPIVFGALLPDLDVTFGRHRKTLHNLPVLAAVVVYPQVFGVLRYLWIGVAAHYALDTLSGRRGLAWLYPLSDSEWGVGILPSAGTRYATTAMAALTVVEIGLIALLDAHGISLLNLWV